MVSAYVLLLVLVLVPSGSDRDILSTVEVRICLGDAIILFDATRRLVRAWFNISLNTILLLLSLTDNCSFHFLFLVFRF